MKPVGMEAAMAHDTLNNLTGADVISSTTGALLLVDSVAIV